MSLPSKEYISNNVNKYRQQEDSFAELLEKLNYGKTRHSDPKTDYKEHWDIELINNNNKILIDVKSIKKIKHEDDKVNDQIHYIEIKNSAGYDGWLKAGKADCIAFEMEKQWVIVDKDKLQKFISEKCTDDKMYNKPMLYKHYHHNPKDDIVLVETNELIKIARNIIVK